MNLRLGLIMFFLFSTTLVFPQQQQSAKEIKKEADNYFGRKDYLRALPLYLKLLPSDTGNMENKFKTGVCYLYKTDESQKSIEFFEEVALKAPKTKDISYYLGRAYYLNNRFGDALEVLGEAEKDKKIAPQIMEDIKRTKAHCLSGMELVKQPLKVKIENIGPPVNSDGSEYVPVISSDEAVLLFTYKGTRSKGGRQTVFGKLNNKGDYFEDIFYSYRIGSYWTDPEGIDDNINTPGHEATIGLSSDGQKLFLFKDDADGSGDIFTSELSGNTWSFPVRMNSNINSASWEGSASLSPDGKTIYFASERPGGFGGRDLWMSVLNEDSIFGEAVNLGIAINTSENEDAPFIHPDAKTLFFSSTGHKNIGGYDIFMSRLQDNGLWNIPKNIGYPVNTTGDDRYFVVTASGEKGYFSSGRLGGLGQQDIYIVHLKESDDLYALIMIKGKIFADGKETGARIEVYYAEDIKLQGVYTSNSTSGNYLLSLPGGDDFLLKYYKEGYLSHTERVFASKTDSFVELVIDVRMYSKGNEPGMEYIEKNTLINTALIRPEADITIFVMYSAEAKEKPVTNFRFLTLPAYENRIFSQPLNDDTMERFEGFYLMEDFRGKEILLKKLASEEIYLKKEKAEEDTTHVYGKLPPDFYKLKEKDINDPEFLRLLFETAGNVAVKGLIFNVQVGAYRHYENFDDKGLEALGKLVYRQLEDGITRITIGDFSTLNEAEDLRQKAIKLDAGDAFITAMYFGERKLLADVIQNEFYLK